MNEILRLLKENNMLLRAILTKLNKEESEDFPMNVLANLISNNLTCR